MIEKLGLFDKYKLKYTNRNAYNDYKFLLKLQKVNTPPLEYPIKDEYSFKHSGNCGDIIYSIPVMLGIAQKAKVNLHLLLNQPVGFEKNIKHPLGRVMLNEKVATMLKPLLESQEYFNKCAIYENQHTDIDLDQFRKYPILLDRGNIARWGFLVYPVSYDLNQAWLKVKPETSLNDAIVVARSSRYNAPQIDYSVLKKYKKVYFVGVEDEFAEMKRAIPDLKFLPVANFFELASFIAGSKLFIGNQSFPFSIAEGLKINRLLELCYRTPNVNVYGTNGFDFCFQPQFEKLIKMRFEEI